MLELLAPAAHAAAEHGTAEHIEATAFGITPGGYVALAMIVVIALMLWAGVPRIIAKILDDRIALIRRQLDEAAKLRAEAAQLRDEYANKIAGVDREAELLMENAKAEAELILENAEADSKALVARRKRMAEEKIAAAERDAVEELRKRAAMAAAAASRELISRNHDAAADRAQVDEVIAGL